MTAAFTFGAASRKALQKVHPALIRVVTRALLISPIDFRVLEGVRTKKRQAELYAQGRTKPGKIVTWTLNSNHFINKDTGYGHAVDLFPAPYDWENKKAFDKLYAVMMGAASIENVALRSGMDWDRDGVLRERKEHDSPHYELWGRPPFK